jgi:hypothetical protein
VSAIWLAFALQKAQAGPMSSADTTERLYTIEELVELRRNTLRYARSFPAGDERNKHRQVAVSLRALFRGKKWLRSHVRNETWHAGLIHHRNMEAIEHSKELAQHFRDESLRDDQDLEISVVNASGREIHREFVMKWRRRCFRSRHT